MSEKLNKAREYEALHEGDIPEECRPAFHLSPRTGWLNDPNGFSRYQGQYHLFYQYHPYDSHWGPMHWGHAVSEDLLHWRYLPTALAPDAPYDKDGCFSGSAVTLPDGRQLLMYTGVCLERQENGENREIQTQNLAIGDGIDYIKYEGNPVLTEGDLPEGGSRFDFRDPKIWRCEDGSYRAAVANNMRDRGGQILLYRSDDAIHWTLRDALACNDDRIGLMWECPDFFSLDGYEVLLASAQDMLPKGTEYQNGNGSFYLLGHWDRNTERFVELCDHATDYGIDFYAPQTVLTPDGRRVMIGWMQNWDTCNLRTRPRTWFGQMSLPRELSIRNGVLYQRPIRELETLWTGEFRYDQVMLCDEEIQLPGVTGRCLDLDLELNLEPTARELRCFRICFAQDGQYHTSVSFRPCESVLKIDRSFSGSRRAAVHQRETDVNSENGRLKLRLILDRYSAEVFVNNGEKVLSVTIDTGLSAQGISFAAEGTAQFRLIAHPLAG